MSLGKLEKAILEKGVIEKNGKFTKITVFNGPTFDEDNRFFRGIQIPMEFCKIVLLFNEHKKLQATAFKLSQATLVGNIDWENSASTRTQSSRNISAASLRWRS